MARHSLAIAFTLSLAVHLAFFGGWKLGKRLGWWEHQATWLLDRKKKLSPKALRPASAQNQMQPAQQEVPLTFVEVDPATAVAEPPKEAKYYSAQNARAANPTPEMEMPTPKAEGSQNKVPRVEDASKPNPQPLQPAAPPPQKTPEELQPKPKGTEAPGDLAKAKPEDLKKPNDGKTDLGTGQAPVVSQKPRTLAEARQRKPMSAGETMKQSGGVRERGKLALDARATPFGSYDAALIAAVQQRWYDLLDSTQFAQRSGKVILEFRLYHDGRITDMKVAGNDVGEILGLLCQRAVLDPSPFAQWPNDMRRAIGKNYRDVMFTFYYN